jgi:mannose-1-phosphate guanylyltransferase
MLPLVGAESLFRISVTRLAPLLPPERIFVVTGADYVDGLRADVPELPAANFIVEPFGQDSGPAAALGVATIAKRDPQALIAILTADHYIRDVWAFCEALRAAYTVAADGYIVTLGVQPSAPATGFGYIQRGEVLRQVGDWPIYHSAGFKEKPNLETAQQFLQSGLYAWNSGMFIWSAERALAEFAAQQPKLYAPLMAIQAALGTPEAQTILAQKWRELPKISLDYAVMEKAERMAMIPIDIGWTDIGSWEAVYDELCANPQANVQMGGGQSLTIDTRGTLVNSSRLVITIGVQDLVIVDTDDVLMVCGRGASQDVKQAVQYLKDHGLEQYL